MTKWVVLAVDEDGTQHILGTPKGNAFNSMEKAEYLNYDVQLDYAETHVLMIEEATSG